MHTLIASLAVLSLGAVALAQPALPPPFPRPGIEKAFENDDLVVWKGVLGVKGVPTAMHRHELDLVGVFLDAGQVRNQQPDGTLVVGNPFPRGTTVFQARGVTHREEVLVDGTRAVGIEAKRPAKPSAHPAITPDDGRTLVDNDVVLIREYTWSPGVTVRQTALGANSVIVWLESGEIADARDGRPEVAGQHDAVVFGGVAIGSGWAARQTIATCGTP